MEGERVKQGVDVGEHGTGQAPSPGRSRSSPTSRNISRSTSTPLSLPLFSGRKGGDESQSGVPGAAVGRVRGDGQAGGRGVQHGAIGQRAGAVDPPRGASAFAGDGPGRGGGSEVWARERDAEDVPVVGGGVGSLLGRGAGYWEGVAGGGRGRLGVHEDDDAVHLGGSAVERGQRGLARIWRGVRPAGVARDVLGWNCVGDRAAGRPRRASGRQRGRGGDRAGAGELQCRRAVWHAGGGGTGRRRRRAAASDGKRCAVRHGTRRYGERHADQNVVQPTDCAEPSLGLDGAVKDGRRLDRD